MSTISRKARVRLVKQLRQLPGVLRIDEFPGSGWVGKDLLIFIHAGDDNTRQTIYGLYLEITQRYSHFACEIRVTAVTQVETCETMPPYTYAKIIYRR